MGLPGGAALMGLAVVLPLGGIIKNPWKPKAMGIQGDGTLWTTGWTLVDEGEKVYLGRDTAAIAEHRAKRPLHHPGRQSPGARQDRGP